MQTFTFQPKRSILQQRFRDQQKANILIFEILFFIQKLRTKNLSHEPAAFSNEKKIGSAAHFEFVGFSRGGPQTLNLRQNEIEVMKLSAGDSETQEDMHGSRIAAKSKLRSKN